MLPKNDAELSQWLGNFITVANANLPALGLIAADVSVLQTLKNELDAKITADTTAREAASAASEAKQAAVKSAMTGATPRAKMILANPAVPAALKEQLGLKLPKPRANTPPTTPVAVTVLASPNGVNAVSWSAGTNIRTTQYLVQQKRSQNGAWTIVGATTKQRFEHKVQVPGRHVLYRVIAQRGDVESAPSVEAVAYGNASFPLENDGIVESVV